MRESLCFDVAYIGKSYGGWQSQLKKSNTNPNKDEDKILQSVACDDSEEKIANFFGK